MHPTARTWPSGVRPDRLDSRGLGRPLDGTPVVSPGPHYGRAISWTMADNLAISAANTYLGYANWFPQADVGTPIDSNGDPAGITIVIGNAQFWDEPTETTDGGHADYDIFQRARSFSGTNNDPYITVSNIPYSKYDVFIGIQELDNFSGDDESFGNSVAVSVGGQTVHWGMNDAGYTAVAAPVPFKNSAVFPTDASYDEDYAVFRDLTGSSFVLTAQDLGRWPPYCAVCFIQLRERTDGNTTLAEQRSRKFIAVGDSYTEGTRGEYHHQARAYLANTYAYYPSAIEVYGVGGSTFEAQYTGQVQPTDLSNSLLLWWDGHANNYDNLTNYMTRVAGMVTQKGDDNWVVILPVPVPNDFPDWTTYNAFVASFKADLLATYDAKNVFDPTPVLQALDPDTSIGGLPSSVFADTHHLTEAAQLACAEAIAEHIHAFAMI